MEVPDTPNLDKDPTWAEAFELFLALSDDHILLPEHEIKLARRFTWEAFNDKRLDSDQEIMMTCKDAQYNCVNPDHMMVI